MPTKKIIRSPVEKLSSEAIVEITEDSSSEEEDDTALMIKPKVKKPRTAKQLANDQKLRDRKKAKVADESLDVSTHPVNPISLAIDDDDKPLTARQMKAYMTQMNQSKPAPVKKPRKPRATKAEMAARKSEKVVIETPVAPPPTPPPPPLKRAKPEMMWA